MTGDPGHVKGPQIEELISTDEGIICVCVLDFLDECISRCTGDPLLTYS